MRVVVNGSISISSHVTSGVPQGSILGPLLFLIYINSVSSLSFYAGTPMFLYADDILLYRPIASSSDYVMLQDNVNSIQTWVDMSLNSNSCLFRVGGVGVLA